MLDLQARDSIDERLRGKFNLNILYSEGLLEGRIGENGYVSVSGRRSYFDLIAGPVIEARTGTTQQLPYLSDYQLKSTYVLTEKHHLTVNAFAAIDRFKIIEEQESTEVGGSPDSTVLFENGFNGQGIHLRSDFTDQLTSHLSLTRSDNFLNIDLQAVSETMPTFGPDGEQESLLENFVHYEIKVSAPVYTLREDVSYGLTPTLQLESGFLYAFNPAKSSEKGWVEENFVSDIDLSFTVEPRDDEVIAEGTFEEVHEEFGTANCHLNTVLV